MGMAKNGFTIIELIVVIAIVAVLVALSIYSYNRFINATKRTSIVTDLRNCLSVIAASKQTGDTQDITSIVNDCTKGQYTNDIVVESTSPIKLKAVSTEGDLYCTYDESTGRVECDTVF